MLLKLFITFFKIGAFTFGGGFAMIPIIQQEMVEKNNWIKDEDFLDIISVAQSAPGPIAVNASVYVGYKIKGLPGALVAAGGTVLPSFLTILLIAIFFSRFSENIIIQKIFLGIRPAVVALILSAIYGLLKSSRLNRGQLLLALTSFFIIVFLDLNPIYMIILGIAISIFYNKSKNSSNYKSTRTLDD
ncbi:MAG: chromate transporter [Tissierellia bacterium]|nr:chromate transporter [Tissierellia bacterium]